MLCLGTDLIGLLLTLKQTNFKNIFKNYVNTKAVLMDIHASCKIKSIIIIIKIQLYKISSNS